MWTKLHWVDGPWPGKLALSERPRGGEWLRDDLADWRRAGVKTVLSLLTSQEERDLDLVAEPNEVRAQEMNFLSMPVPDYQLPTSESELTAIVERVDADLSAGRNVVVHCRQGIGRSGLVAACLLVTRGLDAGTAVKKLSVARGVEVPETSEQRNWIDHYAAVLASAR